MDCASDEVRAHQQLLDLGLTAGQIARRTHVPTAHVKVTAAVARSELAAAVLDRYDLTLDQVAVIAEFDDGTDTGVDAAKVLTVTAAKEPAQFAHVAQRLRDDRTDAALLVEQVAELTAAGVPILDSDHAGAEQQISGLRANADVPSGTELTPEQHATCPGHAAQVEVRRGWDREPQVRVAYWCTDPDSHGHVARWNHPVAGTAGTEAARGSRRPPTSPTAPPASATSCCARAGPAARRRLPRRRRPRRRHRGGVRPAPGRGHRQQLPRHRPAHRCPGARRDRRRPDPVPRRAGLERDRHDDADQREQREQRGCRHIRFE